MIETVLGALAPILARLGQVLIRNDFNLIWCVATFLYFAFWLALLFWRAIPIRRALGRVTRPLAKIDGAAAFAGIFEAYAKQVRAERCLVHAWSEFDESLVKPREGEASRIRNTREPSWYFHDAAIIEPVVHNRFLETVPSHLVGLGILGTFLGLAAGVGLASGKLGSASATPQEIQQALSQLLSGASLAFMTSIVGLGCSLLFLWVERSLVGSAHRRLGAWVSKLESCVQLVTPEQIALDQLEQATRQTQQLERFNTDLVFALEKALEEKVANRLAPALEKVVQAVEALRVDRADSNVSAMQKLVEEFTRNLTQSTGREMKQIAETLEALGERFRTLITAAEESQNRSRGMIDNAAQSVLDALVSGASAITSNLRSAVEELSSNVRGASADLSQQVVGAGAQIGASSRASAEQISASLRSFSESVARLDQTTAAQNALADRVQELAAGLRNAGESVAEAHRGFASSLDASRAVARSIEAASARVADSLAETARLVEQTAAAGKAMQAEQERIAAVWLDYEERFRGVDQALQRAFQQIEEGVGRYTSQIQAFHTEVDQHMGKAVEKLGSVTGELLTAVEDLGEKLPPERR